MPKKILVVLLAAMVLLACPLTAGALSVNSVPYTTYDYNFYEESIASPAGYIPAEKITGETLGLELGFSTPTDIYYDNKDSIYLLDSDNGRIIVMDENFNLKTVLDRFLDQQGEVMTFAGAEGFAVGEDGKYYIADTKNERVLVFNPDHTLLREILLPEGEGIDEGLPFDANKVMVDNRNNVYVLARSNNMGAFVFDKDGNYLRFFGGNKVVKTSEVVLKYLLRNFLTQEQLDGMVSSTPINLASFDVDGEGFVYTSTVVSGAKEVPAGVIRKLNYLGDNILDETIIFGDLEWDRQSKTTTTDFIDLDVDENGFINMLDSGRGKVFQYTERGELVAVFGSYGTQFGTFTIPQALESIGDRVVVVDSAKNCLYVYEPTSYGARYREAIIKLQNDDFDGSLDIWEQLLAENSNNADAYYGIGRVYDMQGEYASAMKYYKLAGDRNSYSEAFREYRNLLIEQMFLPVVGALIALFVLVKVVKYLRRNKVKKAVSNSAYSKLESKYTFPLYTLFHPMDGFQQLKPRKIGSWKVVWGLLVALFVVFTLEYFATGYIFNLNRAVDYSLPIMLLKTIGIALLFIIANWAVCTLFNGNGNLKEISCVTAYSLVPLIAAMLFKVVASNFLSASEGSIMNIFLVLGIIWTVLLLLCGLSCIHEYTMTQSVFSAIATIIGMAVIVFLIIMFFSLMQQTISFVQSIVTEIVTR